jgi:hypothetical protein
MMEKQWEITSVTRHMLIDLEYIFTISNDGVCVKLIFFNWLRKYIISILIWTMVFQSETSRIFFYFVQ